MKTTTMRMSEQDVEDQSMEVVISMLEEDGWAVRSIVPVSQGMYPVKEYWVVFERPDPRYET